MLCGWAYANCTMQGLLHGSVRDSCISELYIRAYPQWSAICGHCPTCLFSSPSTALHKPQTNSGNAFFIGHSRNTVLIWRRWEKLNQITLAVKKTDFGNENWEGCRSTEVFWPIRCFQSEKDFPPRNPTLLLLLLMRNGVWWLPARGLQIGGFDWRWPGVDVVKCQRRVAGSLLIDSGENTTAYWRKETAAGCDSLKRQAGWAEKQQKVPVTSRTCAGILP